MGPLLASPPLPLLPVDTHTHAHSRAHTHISFCCALSPSLSRSARREPETQYNYIDPPAARSCSPSPAYSSRQLYSTASLALGRVEAPTVAA